MPGMITVRPLFDDDRRAAARVFVRAFPDKMSALLGRRHGVAEALIAELLAPGPNSWVAADEQAGVVGVALCIDRNLPSPGLTSWRIYRRHLPPLAAVRAFVVGRYVFTDRLSDDMLYVDAIAVEPAWQGRGIGRALMRFVTDEARRRGRTSLTLWVIDRNHRARELYEKLGFERRRTLHTKLLKPLVGFATSDYMQKRLD
jgi:ribosomal protein S18 acetylase RimI-like enzyme